MAHAKEENIMKALKSIIYRNYTSIPFGSKIHCISKLRKEVRKVKNSYFKIAYNCELYVVDKLKVK